MISRNGLPILSAALFLLVVVAMAGTAPPLVNTEFSGASVEIAADSAWVLLPGQCVTIAWETAETLRVSVDNQDKANLDKMEYCPSLWSASPELDVFGATGSHKTYILDIRFLPSELARCLSLLTVLILLILALYYLATERISAPIPLGGVHFLSFVALLLLCLLFQTGDLFRIEYLLDVLSRLFSNRAWQAFGLLLIGLIFTPLALQTVQEGLKKGAWQDFVAIGAFFLFVLFLYLPFGFDSVGHWEEWVFRAFLESNQPEVPPELVSRFWILVPSVLAKLLGPQSFAGYHLVSFLMFWGKLALFYGIMRKFKLVPLLAFLTALLCMVYPVNTRLMSLRNFAMNGGELSLLVAVFFCMEFMEQPRRLRLAGVWLATLFHIGIYEVGYAIIAVIPLLWWWRSPRRTWRNVNLTVIWYLFPAVKVAYLLLLYLDNSLFYGRDQVAIALGSEQFALDSIAYYAGIIGGVYRQTFWYGWREALSAVSQSAWIAPAIGTVAFTGFIAAYLARAASKTMFPSRRWIVIGLSCGLLFLLPSIGVLMWIGKYNTDLWRMYVYVPIGAAITVFSLVLLVASFVRSLRLRQAFVICVCLVAMIPALARLFAQHSYYVNSANNKAKILLQIVEQAPAIDSEAYIVLASEMLGTDLRAKGVSEFRTTAFFNALRVVYQDVDIYYAFICIIDKRCFLDQYSTQPFHLEDNTDYSNVVLFWLHEDLKVELLRELPIEFGGSQNETYKPDRLIDFSAPVPSRALTMLASAWRD